jgi:hypothetical protein
MKTTLPTEGKIGTHLDDPLHCIAAAEHAAQATGFVPTQAERARIEKGKQLKKEAA